MSSPPSNCAKERCPRLAVLGSRCVRHWLHRQAAYKKLPTKTVWWRKYEPGLVAGIEVRVNLGEAAPPPIVWLPTSRQKWAPLVTELIVAAEYAWRKHDSVRSEEGGDNL